MLTLGLLWVCYICSNFNVFLFLLGNYNEIKYPVMILPSNSLSQKKARHIIEKMATPLSSLKFILLLDNFFISLIWMNEVGHAWIHVYKAQGCLPGVLILGLYGTMELTDGKNFQILQASLKAALTICQCTHSLTLTYAPNFSGPFPFSLHHHRVLLPLCKLNLGSCVACQSIFQD